jgi:glutathione S-transferase
MWRSRVVKSSGAGDFEPLPIRLHKGEQRSAEYLAMNPDGQVPMLVVDGQVLTQIVAICDYIDRRFPSAGLPPTEPWARAQAMSTLAWFSNTVHPTFTHVFMPQKFSDDAGAQALIKAPCGPAVSRPPRADPVAGGRRRALICSGYAVRARRLRADPAALGSASPASIQPRCRSSRPSSSGFAQHPQVAAVMAREKVALDTFKG